MNILFRVPGSTVFYKKKLIYNKILRKFYGTGRDACSEFIHFSKFREIDFTKKILRNRFDEIFNRYSETYRLPYFQHFAHQSMNVISTSMKLFTGLNEKKIIYNNHKILIETCNTNILKALVFYSMLTFWIRDCNSVICGLKSFATSWPWW